MQAVGFPSPVAAKLTGVTDGTLEHWNDRAFLKPSVRARGRGRVPRLYSFRDLVAIRMVDQLRERGLDVRHLHGVVAYVRNREGLELDRDFSPHRLMLTDGSHFLEKERIEEFAQVHWPKLPDVLLFVSFGDLVTKLQREARPVARALLAA